MFASGSRLDREDRRGLVTALVLLVVTSVSYPLYADLAARPLAVFAVPPLLAAVLSGWRATALAGVASIAVAAVVGISGPLDGPAVAARLIIITLAAGLGGVGAALRERQQHTIASLDATTTTLQSFQGALVPTLAAPDGFVVAARYLPADTNMSFGGDFLDVAPLSDGRLGLVIGDVAGHGPRAAALGAAVRAGWRAIVYEGRDDPAEWVRRLNAAFFDPNELSLFITLCTGFLDPRHGRLCLVSAGHPAPVALGREPHLLPLPAGRPLGLGEGDWHVTHAPWDDEPLLFYTDGLVENPRLEGRPERWNEDGLLGWLRHEARVGEEPSRLADRLVTAATAGREVRDDVAVLIVQP